jgi:hypothetical protein
MADSNNVVTLAHREQKPVSEVSEVSDVYTPSTYLPIPYSSQREF